MQVRVTGSTTLLDLVNFLTKAQKDPQYGPTLNTLFIVDPDAQFGQLAPGTLATFFKRVAESGGSKAWAIVFSTDSHYTIFSELVQNNGTNGLKIRLFRDEFTALQWLHSE